MTKKHFEALASAFLAAMRASTDRCERKGIRDAMLQVAGACYASNNRFNSARFLAAAGYDEHLID